MTRESDVGKELLRQDARRRAPARTSSTGPSAARGVACALWAAATVALWVAVAGYCIVSTYLFLMFFYPKLEIYVFSQGDHTMDREVVVALADCLLISNIIWPTLLLAAALATVVFVLKSRRATLRQIQAELAGISEQMRALTQKH